MAIDAAELQAEMARALPDGEELQKAKRTLKDFGKDQTKSNLRIVVAAKRIFQRLTDQDGKERKITPSVFNACSEDIVKTSREYKTVYKVPTGKFPKRNAHARLKKYILSPEALEEVPVGFDPETHFLVDDGFPKNDLGTGVTSFETSLAKESRFHVQRGGGSPSKPTEQHVPLIEELEEDDSELALKAPPKAAQQGKLTVRAPLRLPSSPGGEVQLILSSTEECFSRGMFDSPDKLGRTAKYWISYFQLRHAHRVLTNGRRYQGEPRGLPEGRSSPHDRDARQLRAQGQPPGVVPLASAV